jgi:hypothetical protein
VLADREEKEKEKTSRLAAAAEGAGGGFQFENAAVFRDQLQQAKEDNWLDFDGGDGEGGGWDGGKEDEAEGSSDEEGGGGGSGGGSGGGGGGGGGGSGGGGGGGASGGSGGGGSADFREEDRQLQDKFAALYSKVSAVDSDDTTFASLQTQVDDLLSRVPAKVRSLYENPLRASAARAQNRRKDLVSTSSV